MLRDVVQRGPLAEAIRNVRDVAECGALVPFLDVGGEVGVLAAAHGAVEVGEVVDRRFDFLIRRNRRRLGPQWCFRQSDRRSGSHRVRRVG